MSRGRSAEDEHQRGEALHLLRYGVSVENVAARTGLTPRVVQAYGVRAGLIRPEPEPPISQQEARRVLKVADESLRRIQERRKMAEKQKAQIRLFSPPDIEVGDSVVGHVSGHPSFADGAFVRTSNVVRVFEGGFETRNTLYEITD